MTNVQARTSDQTRAIGAAAIGLLAVSVATIALSPLVVCTPMCEPLFRLGQLAGVSGSVASSVTVFAALQPLRKMRRAMSA